MIKSRMGKVLRILRYVRPYLGHQIQILICMFLAILMSLVDPLIVKLMIDKVLVYKLTSQLSVIMVALIVLALFAGLFRIISGYLYSYVGQKILFDIRNQLFRHLERMHLGFFASRKTGDIMSRIGNDVRALQALASTTFISVIADVITVAGILILVLLLNWKLSLIALIITPIFLFVVIGFGRKIRKQSHLVREKVSDITSFFQEIFPAMRLVQSFGREEHEALRLQHKGNEMIGLRVKLTLLGTTSSALTGFIIMLGPILVLWLGGLYVIRDQMTLGTLIAFYAYISRLFGPIYRLAQVNVQLQGAMASVDRIFEYLDIEPQISDGEGAIEARSDGGRIALRDVWFGYEPDQPVLKGVNFEIQRGEVVALVGPSGVGKTTVANLICRFYEPDRGRVLFDGRDIRDFKIASMRRMIALVSQDPVLFNAAVRENLQYARDNLSEDEIITAAKKAQIHDFVMSLPEGYATVVGDRGVKLSGGQRQRIAIARALLKDARIVILDEAMSSLDSESERMIQEALEPLMKGRTTLVIAHRFSTVLRADRILVLDDARVVEEGHHEGLYRQCELYRRLYDMQFNPC